MNNQKCSFCGEPKVIERFYKKSTRDELHRQNLCNSRECDFKSMKSLGLTGETEVSND